MRPSDVVGVVARPITNKMRFDMPNNCNVCEPSCTCGCQTGTPKFVNLTEGIVRIFDPKVMKLIDSEYSYLDVGYDVKLFNAMATLIVEPSGVALSDKNVKMHTIQKPCYTLYGEVYSGTVAVPAPADDTLYIVSEKILRANPYRDDLVVPYKPVKCYGVAANGPEDVVIGYCGFYKPYLPEDEEDSSPIYVISKPTKISGFTGDRVSMGVSFESADPAVTDITVTYTPINCAVIDTFVEPEETVPSGTTKMIAGTLIDANYHLAKLQVVVGASEGFITITYGDNVETTIKVAVKESTATSVAWDDITDKPEEFPPSAHTHEVADVTDFSPSEYITKTEFEELVKDMVKMKEFVYNGETRKTLELKNYDSISGVMTNGIGVNLATVSKHNVADFGSPQLPANMNTTKNDAGLSIMTVNDNDVIVTDKLMSQVVTAGDDHVSITEINGEQNTKKLAISVNLDDILSRLSALETAAASK